MSKVRFVDSSIRVNSGGGEGGGSSISASYALTSSYSNFSISSSYVATASYSNFATSASYAEYAVSASHEIVKEVSSSYADTASLAQSGNGPFTGSFTGSFIGNGTGLFSGSFSGSIPDAFQIISGSVSASISPDNGLKINSGVDIAIPSGSAFTITETDKDQKGRLDFTFDDGDPTLEIEGRSSVAKIVLSANDGESNNLKIQSDGQVYSSGVGPYTGSIKFLPNGIEAVTVGTSNSPFIGSQTRPFYKYYMAQVGGQFISKGSYSLQQFFLNSSATGTQRSDGLYNQSSGIRFVVSGSEISGADGYLRNPNNVYLQIQDDSTGTGNNASIPFRVGKSGSLAINLNQSKGFGFNQYYTASAMVHVEAEPNYDLNLFQGNDVLGNNVFEVDRDGNLTVDAEISASGDLYARDGRFSRDGGAAEIEIIASEIAGGIIGTQTSDNLLFRRFNIPKFTISESRNFSHQNLDVQGNIEATGVISASKFTANSGSSALLPGYTFHHDSGTGLYSSGVGLLSLQVGGGGSPEFNLSTGQGLFRVPITLNNNELYNVSRIRNLGSITGSNNELFISSSVGIDGNTEITGSLTISGSGLGSFTALNAYGNTTLGINGWGSSHTIYGNTTFTDAIQGNHHLTINGDTILGNAITDTIELKGHVTASGNISSSAISTASFGTYLGDGSQLTGIEFPTGAFGISDSSGSYTYYTSLSASMAAAVSGDVVEVFANTVISGSDPLVDTILFKNGVNIFGNGYTYTLNHSSSMAAFADYAAQNTTTGTDISCSINEFNIRRISSDASSKAILINNKTSGKQTSLNLHGSTIYSSEGITYNASFTYGTVDGGHFSGDTTGAGFQNNASSADTKPYVKNAHFYFPTGYTTVEYADNCQFIGETGTYALNAYGRISNCYVFSKGSISANAGGSNAALLGCHVENGSSGIAARGFYKISDSTIISNTGFAVRTYGNANCELTNNRIYASGYVALDQYTSYSTGKHIISNNLIITDSTTYAACQLKGAPTNDFLFSNNTVFNRGDNANSHGVKLTNNGSSHQVYMANNTIKVFNVSANCITAASSADAHLADNIYDFASVPVNAFVTQSFTNVPDNQGNIHLTSSVAYNYDFTGATSISGSTLLLSGSLLNSGTVSLDNTDSPYTITGTQQFVLIDPSGGDVTINMPDAATYPGREIRFKLTQAAGANTVTLQRQGADTIDGATTYTDLDIQYESISTVSDGSTGWFIF